MTDSTCLTTFFAVKYNCYTKPKNTYTNEERLVQFFTISCKTRNSFMELDWHFSFPTASICCEQMYIQISLHLYTICTHILPSIYSSIRTFIFCSSNEPHFPTKQWYATYHTPCLCERRIRKKPVSSKASYAAIFTILMSQHLLVGQRLSFWWEQTNNFFPLTETTESGLESNHKE